MREVTHLVQGTLNKINNYFLIRHHGDLREWNDVLTVLKGGKKKKNYPPKIPSFKFAVCYGLNYVPPKYGDVLTPSSCEHDLIWK